MKINARNSFSTKWRCLFDQMNSTARCSFMVCWGMSSPAHCHFGCNGCCFEHGPWAGSVRNHWTGLVVHRSSNPGMGRGP